MAQGFSGIGKDIDFLVTEINRQFNNSVPTVPTVYEKIALVDTVVKSESMLYPMKVASTKEIARGATEQRQFSDAEIVNFSCPAGRLDQENGELIPMMGPYDPYSLVQNFAGDLLRQGMSIWDRQLATKINQNPIGYDGVPFFGTHSTNPLKVGAGTFTNDIIAGTDEGGVQGAIDTMMHIVGYDGTFLNKNPKLVFVCPSMKTKLPLDKLLHEGLIAQQVGAAAASANTRLAGWGETLLYQELFDFNVPNSDNYYYLVNVDYGSRRPFIVRAPQRPMLKLTPGNDYFEHTRNARGLYYVAFGGVNVAMPQLILRCKAF